MRTIPNVLAAGGFGIALGLVLATLRPGGDPGDERTARATSPAPPSAAIRELEDALREERSARDALERELVRLQTALAEAAPGLEPDPDAPPPPADAPAAVAAAAEARFDHDALQELGFRATDIARLEERSERLDLEELYLHNQARREGWLRGPRYQQELRGLREDAVQDLGDDGYDALRYARGEKNRVVVARLLPDSPATSIGLQAGDALLSYGGERILDPRAIAEATALGRAGELTELRVERDGEELRFFLPRGPIGVQLGRERRAPLTR